MSVTHMQGNLPSITYNVRPVADALNLTIHFVESNTGFASVTKNNSVNSETDTTVINLGHVDETYNVSNVPFV